MDGSLHLEVNTQLAVVGAGKPFLEMNKVYDATCHDGSEGQVSDDLAVSQPVRLKVQGTCHLWFSDLAWLASPSTAKCGAALARDAGVVWFFDTYLQGESPPFPTNTELYHIQRN